MSAKSSPTLLPAAIAAGLLIAGGGAAYAQSVSEVDVNARAPTQIAINLVGKSTQTVRVEVRQAASTVCRNAVGNRELEMGDLLWCKQKSTAKALRRYDDILERASQTASLPGTIILSSR